MIALWTLWACSGTDPDETGTTPTTACDVTATASIADGATAVPGNDAIAFTLSEADPTATVTASAPGTAAASPDGLVWTWTPSPPLDPLTDVSVTLTTCAGPSTIHYTTADLGGPLDPSVDLAATGFRVDLASGTILQPVAGEALLSVLSAAGTEILVGLLPTATGAVDYRLAVTADGSQDLCSRTLDVPGGTLDRGWFALAPTEATFFVYDTEVVLHDLALGGAIRPDGSGIDAGWLRTWVGVEALAVAYADGDVTAACAFFADLAAPCVPCPDTDSDCLAIEVRDLSGTATGAPVAEVLESCPTP